MLFHNMQQLLLLIFSTTVNKTEFRVKAPSKHLLLSHFPTTRVATSSPQMFIFLESKYQGDVTFISFYEIKLSSCYITLESQGNFMVEVGAKICSHIINLGSLVFQNDQNRKHQFQWPVFVWIFFQTILLCCA